MSLTGATGPAPIGTETGSIFAAMNTARADHARMAAHRGTAPDTSFPLGEGRIDPPGVPVPAALKAMAARIQGSPLAVGSCTRSGIAAEATQQPADRCRAGADGLKQIVPSQKANGAAPPSDYADLL